MPETTDFTSEVSQEDNKNIRNVKCKYCSSLILTPNSASFQKSEFQLPCIQQKKADVGNPETEKTDEFWVVNDMFTFYNVGFSNTVGNTKYLTCADCDAGPIGYHDIPSKISYVALTRVDHS